MRVSIIELDKKRTTTTTISRWYPTNFFIALSLLAAMLLNRVEEDKLRWIYHLSGDGLTRMTNKDTSSLRSIASDVIKQEMMGI
jgi:hypothetical protein